MYRPILYGPASQASNAPANVGDRRIGSVDGIVAGAGCPSRTAPGRTGSRRIRRFHGQGAIDSVPAADGARDRRCRGIARPAVLCAAAPRRSAATAVRRWPQSSAHSANDLAGEPRLPTPPVPARDIGGIPMVGAGPAMGGAIRARPHTLRMHPLPYASRLSSAAGETVSDRAGAALSRRVWRPRDRASGRPTRPRSWPGPAICGRPGRWRAPTGRRLRLSPRPAASGAGWRSPRRRP